MFNKIKFSIAISTAIVTLSVVSAVFAAEGSSPVVQLDKLIDDDSPENIKIRGAPGDSVKGKDKSAICQGCHGENGMSGETMVPHLAGQYGTYISKKDRKSVV